MTDAESGELGVPTTQKPSKKTPRPTAPVVVPKNAYDVQRLKLERLMEHPERPVVIPEPAKPRAPHEAPEFVRNVMGSSAGAGSGEFHVYRHLRRKEYARQKYIDQRAHEDLLDVEFRERVERNRREAEERTAKKRAKRQRRKQKAKERRTSGKTSAGSGADAGAGDSSSSEEDDERENDDGNRASEDATTSEQTQEPTATEVIPSTTVPSSSPEDQEEQDVGVTEAATTSTLASAKPKEDSPVEFAAPDNDGTISAGHGNTDDEPRRARMITADAVDICTQAATGSETGEPAEGENASQARPPV